MNSQLIWKVSTYEWYNFWGLDNSILLILQLGAFDKGDISGKQGKLEDVYLKEANKLVRELLGF